MPPPTTWQTLLSKLELSFYGNTVHAWLLAICVALLLFALFKILQAILVARLQSLTEKFPTDAGTLAVAAIASLRLWFLLILALFAGSLLLSLPPKSTTIIHSGMIIALLLQAALTGNELLGRLIRGYSQKNLASDAASVTTVTTLGFLGRLTLWVVVALLALQNLGVNISALVTGLGIGGIAVALAAQNILGDLFASLSIVLDKPFVLGDFIIVGEQMGTVEKIGIKSTHLRSLSGEQLIISNADLLKSRIRNCKRMEERRIVFTVNVPYQTLPEKILTIVQLLREAVEQQQPVRFDRAHFRSFGASSLEFEVVYFVLSPDYNLYMDIQQRINLLLIERFAEENIEFAYPKPTTMVLQQPPPSEAVVKNEAPTKAGAGQ